MPGIAIPSIIMESLNEDEYGKIGVASLYLLFHN